MHTKVRLTERVLQAFRCISWFSSAIKWRFAGRETLSTKQGGTRYPVTGAELLPPVTHCATSTQRWRHPPPSPAVLHYTRSRSW